MNWFAIYTKPRCEGSTALQLSKAGIETLNPKIRTKRYIRGKYTSLIEPFSPGYIFACCDLEKQGHMIKYTRGVKFVVGKQTPLTVPQTIIETIQERMDGDIVTPAPEKLNRGDRVIIKEGLLVNFYGIFERDIPGREHAMILLETLHSKVEIKSLSIRKA